MSNPLKSFTEIFQRYIQHQFINIFTVHNRTVVLIKFTRQIFQGNIPQKYSGEIFVRYIAYKHYKYFLEDDINILGKYLTEIFDRNIPRMNCPYIFQNLIFVNYYCIINYINVDKYS